MKRLHFSIEVSKSGRLIWPSIYIERQRPEKTQRGVRTKYPWFEAHFSKGNRIKPRTKPGSKRK